MALQEQLVQFPFAGGLDESVDERVLEPPALLSVVNGVYAKDGSITKRYGFTSLASLGGNCRRMASRGDELLALTRDNVFTYNSQDDAWTNRDRIPQPVCTRADAINVTADILEFDSHYANGYLLDVWINAEDANVYGQVTDAATGALIFGPLRVNFSLLTFRRVRVASIGTTGIFSYSTSGAIYFKTIDLTNPAAGLSAEQTFAGSLANTGAYSLSTNSTNAFVAFEVAGNQIQISRFNSSLVNVGNATLAAGGNGFEGVSSAIVDANLFVAYTDTGLGNSTARVVVVATSNLATVLGATSVIVTTANTNPRLGIVRVATNTAIVVTSARFTGSNVRWRQVNSAGTLGQTRTVFRALLATNAFTVNGRIYAGVTSDVEQPSFVLLDLNSDDSTTASLNGRPVGVMAARQTSIRDLSSGAIGIAEHSSTSFSTLQSVNRTATGRRGMTRMYFDFSGDTNWQTAELAQYLYTSGGVPCQYDGVKLVECGFITPPAITSTSPIAGSIEAGTRQWKVCYAWVDALGRTHRSQPSLPVTDTNGAPGGFALTIRPLTLTARQELDAQAGFPTPVYLEVYRTTNGGTNFRRVTVEPYAVGNQNTLVANIVIINDTMADTTLVDPSTASQHPFLYTTGGVFDNTSPPSFTAICQHQNRIFGIGDDELTVWFSEEFSPPETPAFHDEFTFLMPERATALYSLDDKLVIWTQSSVYIMTGLGPAPNGSGGTYDPPQLITSDVGCIDPRSVVKCPQGVFFLSRLGLMLLTRGLEVQWIGQPVQDTLASFPTVTSAVLVPEQHHVRFTCRDDASAGRTLLWDYVRARWATWSLGDADFPSDAACLWRGTYVTGWSEVLFEDTTTHLDGGALFVPLSIETPNIKVSGITGYQRVWRVLTQFERHTPHGLLVEIARDYGTYTDSHAWTDTQISALALHEPVRRAPQYGKCTAMRVRLTDVEPTVGAVGTGQGATFVALGLLVGVVPGARKKLSSGAKA